MKLAKITPLTAGSVASANVPGSKSYTNRALLLAALIPGTVTIKQALISDDTEAMLDCLETLGIAITRKGTTISVNGDITQVAAAEYQLNARLSGTTIRFLLALCAITPGQQVLQGEAGLNKRPIGDLVEALEQLGAKIEYLDQPGYPPLRVLSSELLPRTVQLKGSTSSQYLSALLMVAPLIGAVTIEVTGELISQPFVAMTLGIMEQFGVNVEHSKYRQFSTKSGQAYKLRGYTVEGDISSASYFFAIAALTRSTITVQNVNPQSLQADMAFLTILEAMGNQVQRGKNSITLIGSGIKAIIIDMGNCPDQAQTLAVLAAFAPGKTVISGIGSLRVKETERIAALEQELRKMGIKTSSTPDSLTVYGGDLQPASIATYGDHRMAMAFAVAASKLSGLSIQQPSVVSKTFPDFWGKLADIGCKVSFVEQNIVLIGMRGSGKTTVASLLSKSLKRKLVDTDQALQEEHQLDLAKLIAERGWDYFRDQEAQITQKAAAGQNQVISTGGGVVLLPENVTALKRQGLVIFLQASPATLVKRLGDTKDRPPLTTHTTLKAEVNEVLHKRAQLYQAAADLIIDTDHVAPKAVAEQIAAYVKGQS